MFLLHEEDTQKITEGEPVHLQTGVTELQEDEEIMWTFEDAIIATVNRKSSDNSVYHVNDEKFKGRLGLDEQTGDLTIMNTKSTDSGVYELQIKNRNKVSYKKFNVLVCLNMLKHTVGDSVTLQTDVHELRNDDTILWKFSDEDILIAELKRANNQNLFNEGPDVRFRDRLQLNQRTGDLTIRNISRAHSDVYTLQITSGKKSTCKRFMVIAHEKTVSGLEGDSVTLNADIEIQEDDLVLWMFGPEDCPIAKGQTKEKISTYDDADGRFRGKLNLNYESGSLTITSTRTEHSGVYKLQVICRRETKYKIFRLTIRESERNPDFGSEKEGIPLVQK